MASITTRAGKGTPLTNTEVDANFTNLNAEVTPARPTIRPSLLLDFANSKTVDERITFTRSTTATYYDAQGVLKYAQPDQPRIDHDPATGECKGLLIEEQRTNLTIRSNGASFAGYAWGSYEGVQQEQVAVAPDGTMSAGGLFASTANTVHYFDRYPITTSSGTYTASFYVKAAGQTTFRSYFVNNNGLVGSDVLFDLSAGTTSNSSVSTISAVGNGWYRCTLTATQSNGTILYYRIYLRGESYAGTGKDGVYVWGVQLEAGSFATSYVPSTDTFTSRASSATYFDSTGVLRTAGVNQARYGYGYDSASGKWVSQGLVLESAATNAVSSSESGFISNGTNMTATTGVTTNPFGSTASIPYARWNSMGSAGTVYVNTAGFSATVGSTYTASVFVKPNGAPYFVWHNYGDKNGVAVFQLSGYGSIVSSSNGGTNNASHTITYAGNGWYRCTFTWTQETGDNTSWYWSPSLTTSYSTQGDGVGGAYFWGYQLESGSVATSYIPTYGSTATRAADVSSSAATTRVADSAVIRGSSFGDFYNPAVGTLYSESISYKTSWWNSAVYMGDDIYSSSTSGRNFIEHVYFQNGTNLAQAEFISNGTTSASGWIEVDRSKYMRMASAYAANDFAWTANGVPALTDSSGAVPTGVTTLKIGNFYVYNDPFVGHIKKISYYPKRLSNTELQALTA